MNTITSLTKTRSTHQVVFVKWVAPTCSPKNPVSFTEGAVSPRNLALLHASGSWKTSKPSETFGLCRNFWRLFFFFFFRSLRGSKDIPRNLPYLGVSQNRRTPKGMVKIMENPIKMDDLGGFNPPFTEFHPYIPTCWWLKSGYSNQLKLLVNIPFLE